MTRKSIGAESSPSFTPHTDLKIDSTSLIVRFIVVLLYSFSKMIFFGMLAFWRRCHKSSLFIVSYALTKLMHTVYTEFYKSLNTCIYYKFCVLITFSFLLNNSNFHFVFIKLPPSKFTIIDFFELIDIHHYQADLIVVALVASELVLKTAFPVAAVE